MRTSPKTIIIDRLAHALGKQGVKLKRDHLITTSAYAYGYRNRETFDAAADAGELTAPAAVDLGPVLTRDGETLIVLRDPRTDRPYAIDEAFVSGNADQRRERYGVSPYGNLLDLSAVMADRGTTETPGQPRTSDAADDSATYVAVITGDTHDRDVLTSNSWTGLLSRIVHHCRGCWHPGFESEAPEGDLDLVEAYFDTVGERSTMEIFVDRGGAAADAIELGDIREIDSRLRTEAGAKTVPVTRPAIEGEAFVIGMVGDGSGEPMSWWSNDDGFGALGNATVFPDMTANLPTAGVAVGAVGWYQLPTMATARDHVAPVVDDLDIDFLTNREAEGGDGIDHLRPYLRAAEPDIGDRRDMTVALGYLAMVNGPAIRRQRGGVDEMLRGLSDKAGEPYFAPTIRAWHDGTHADAVAATAAIDNERKRLEPLVRRLGGFCMMDEGTAEDVVEMTVFIPASVAKGVAPEDWERALDYLLGIGGTPIIADFTPQASVLDNCIDVDPQGETKFDVTFEVLLMGEDAHWLQDHDADDLIDAIGAPDWIRNWPGPFSVHVAAAIARHRA